MTSPDQRKESASLRERLAEIGSFAGDMTTAEFVDSVTDVVREWLESEAARSTIEFCMVHKRGRADQAQEIASALASRFGEKK